MRQRWKWIKNLSNKDRRLEIQFKMLFNKDHWSMSHEKFHLFQASKTWGNILSLWWFTLKLLSLDLFFHSDISKCLFSSMSLYVRAYIRILLWICYSASKSVFHCLHDSHRITMLVFVYTSTLVSTLCVIFCDCIFMTAFLKHASLGVKTIKFLWL